MNFFIFFISFIRSCCRFSLNSGDNIAADDDDRLPLFERAKKLKGKGAEQAEATKDPISLPEKEKHVGAGAKAGKLALLERALKLKKKTEAYVSELVSCGPRFAVDSVRSVDSEPIDPPSLVLPKGTLEEERSAYIIRTDLARLFRLLKKEPFDGVKVVRMLKLLMGQWASMYESPLPADLELLTTSLGALAQRIENGATFEEATLDKDEQAMRSHLQRIEAACSEIAAEFTLVQGVRTEYVNHRQKAFFLHEKYTAMAAEHEQKMKEARKRAEEIQRVADVASDNLTAFDQDLESHGNNIGRLTKLRDELQDRVAQFGEEKERMKAQTPADVAVILAYVGAP